MMSICISTSHQENNILATHYTLQYLDGDKKQQNVNKIRFFANNIDVTCTRVSRD